MARWSVSAWSVPGRSVLREPTVPILLAASVVHVVRRDALDFAVFFGTAVLIVADSRFSAGRRAGGRLKVDAERAGHVAPDRWRRAWLPLLGMTVFAGVAALAVPVSLGARMIVTLIGIAALVLVLCAPGAKNPADRTGEALAGWPVWAVIGVATCLWELTSFIAQQVWPLDQDAHPAVSDLVGPLLDTWFGRAVFLLLWVGAGWWLLRRLLLHGSSKDEPLEAGR